MADAGVAERVHQRLRPDDRARDRRRRAPGGPRAGRGRDRAAVARDLRAGQADAVGRLPRRGRPDAGDRPRPGRVLRRLRPADDARPGRAAAEDRRVQRPRRGSDGRPRALRAASRPTRRCSTSPASRRSRSRSASAPTACRATSSSSASRSTRTGCSRSRCRWRPRTRGHTSAGAGTPTAGRRRRGAVGRRAPRRPGPARAEHLHRQHLGSSQVTSDAGPASVSSACSAARSPASGSGTVRRRRPLAGQHEPDEFALGERLRPRELVADVALGRVLERRDHAVGTSSAQIGCVRAMPRPTSGTSGR